MSFKITLYNSYEKQYVLDPNDYIPSKFVSENDLLCCDHNYVLATSINQIRELVKYILTETNYHFVLEEGTRIF